MVFYKGQITRMGPKFLFKANWDIWKIWKILGFIYVSSEKLTTVGHWSQTMRQEG